MRTSRRRDGAPDRNWRIGCGPDTTTDSDDIFPVHPIARSLCNLESIFGQLYPATLLGRLVTPEIAGRG